MNGFSMRVIALLELISFPFRDAEYLAADQSKGGLAYVPSEVGRGEEVPLVVFLHGVNPTSVVHSWVGGAATPDLTAFAESLVSRRKTAPFILAAPSATRNAMAGRLMWPAFDLDAFVDAVDASIEGRARIDRDAIIVVGHSGAGCNRDGGLLRIASHPGEITPIALVAIDTCLDAESGDSLGQTPPDTSVYVRWQRLLWARPIDRFLVAFHTAAFVTERRDVNMVEGAKTSTNPHVDIVFEALNELLPALLPPDP
jgi:hypothetical protein